MKDDLFGGLFDMDGNGLMDAFERDFVYALTNGLFGRDGARANGFNILDDDDDDDEEDYEDDDDDDF